MQAPAPRSQDGDTLHGPARHSAYYRNAWAPMIPPSPSESPTMSTLLQNIPVLFDVLSFTAR